MKLLKKAELSINMIVVVAISIIVLVVLIYIFINHMGKAEGTVACESLGGQCFRYCDGTPITDDRDVCTGLRGVCCHPMEGRN